MVLGNNFDLIQVCLLVSQMYPTQYPIDWAQLGLVDTLLTGIVLPWFALLVLKKRLSILNNFDEFIKEF